MTKSHFERMYHWYMAAQDVARQARPRGAVAEKPATKIVWLDEAGNFDEVRVLKWWGADYAREKHAPFPANALTDTRTVTMGEPSKVER